MGNKFSFYRKKSAYNLSCSNDERSFVFLPNNILYNNIREIDDFDIKRPNFGALFALASFTDVGELTPTIFEGEEAMKKNFWEADNSAEKRDYDLTEHAVRRMHSRRIPGEAINSVMRYGRGKWARGALILFLGRREVKRMLERGIDLRAYEGLQVVAKPEGDKFLILTVYRNNDFSSVRKGKYNSIKGADYEQ